jgi:hypothetical protein
MDYFFRLQVYDNLVFSGDNAKYVDITPNVYINKTALGITSNKEALDSQYNQYTDPQPTSYATPSDYTQTLIINTTLNDYDEFIIDAENKEVTLNNNKAYDLIDKSKDTFLSIPPGDFVIEADEEITVEYKKWVID